MNMSYQLARILLWLVVVVGATLAIETTTPFVAAAPPHNVAAGKMATQSSRGFGGLPSRAVDQDTNGRWWNKSVTHTAYESQPWWQVDLGTQQPLTALTLWNRTDCCASRLRNFYVFVSSTDLMGRSLNDILVDPAVWRHYEAAQPPVPFNLAVATSGRYVRVQLAGANYLSLAEVEVLGTAFASFTQLPQHGQLYPRNLTTNRATVPIAGQFTRPGYDAVVLEVYRDGTLVETLRQLLTYVNNTADFAFAPNITAELMPYAFEIYASSNGTEVLVTDVTDVVAGDVYLITGQSNAVAQRYNGSANDNQSSFIRTFGSSSPASNKTLADTNWHRAEGDIRYTSGSVGQWGLRFGRLLVDTQQVPIAILNGAHSGQPISFFQRDDTNPTNIETNYGRLLYRAQQAGVHDAVRAILWYQGEADRSNAATHESGFIALHSAWLEDYVNLEHVYIHQLRQGGCGGNITVREVQRRLADTLSHVSVMSTTGINGHDGCHYSYPDGYELIATHLSAVLGRDLYGAPDPGNIDPPNIDHAHFSDANQTEVVLVMRNTTDTLVADANFHAFFQVEGASVTVTSGAVSGHTIILGLSGNAGAATGITYLGHRGAGPWVTNLRGVGLLTFHDAPINAN